MRIQTLAVAASAGLLVVGAGLWSGVSWYAGQRIEAEFRALPAALAGQGLDMRAESFRRGLFSSQAESRWVFARGDEEDAFTLRFAHDIDHTPGLGGQLASVHSRLLLSPELETALRPQLGEASPLSIDSTLTWDGAHRHQAHSPACDCKIDDLTFDWKGLEGQIDVTGDTRQASARFTAPGLGIVDAGTRIQLGAMNAEANQFRPDQYSFWLGDARASVGEVTLGDREAPPILRLSDIRLTSSGTLEAGFVDTTAEIAVASGQLEESHATEIGMKLRLAHLDAGAIDAITLALQQMPHDAGLEQQQSHLTNAFMQHLPALLAGHPEIHFERIGLTLPVGQVAASLRLRYTGKGVLLAFNPESDLEGELKVATPESVLVDMLTEKARSSIVEQLERLEVDKPADEVDQIARREAENQRNQLANSGLFVQDGSQWSLQLVLKEGKLLANDRPIDSLSELTQLGVLF